MRPGPRRGRRQSADRGPGRDAGDLPLKDKEKAAATFKRGYGFHPLCAFVDHGAEGTGEPLAMLLRRGNAGSNTAADHIAVIKQALAQLPGHRPGTRAGRKVLVRADAAGCTHDVLAWMAGQRLSYSVGSRCRTILLTCWR